MTTTQFPTLKLGHGKSVHIDDGSHRFTFCGKGFGSSLREIDAEPTCKQCIRASSFSKTYNKQ